MRPSAIKVLIAFLCSSALLAGCGGGGSSDDPPGDTTPAAYSFVDQAGVATNTVITSAAVAITGIDAPAPVSVAGAGGSYSINDGAFTTATGTLTSGATVRLRHTSAAAASTATNTTLTVGGVSDIFTSTTEGPVADTTPAPYAFTDQAGVATSAVITSAPVTISGITAPAAVTVTGGTYSVGCTATYIGSAGTIDNNQTVCVRHTSASAASTATNTTLTVGGVADIFTSTTAGPVADTTPAPYAFTDQSGVAASTVITSAAVTITGITAPSTVTVAGGTYSVGCTATYIGSASTINNNQTVCVRHTSAAAASTATNTTLTVGGVSDVFTSTTAADTTPAPYAFTDQAGVATSAVITSAPVTISGITAPAAVTVAGGTYSVGCTATFIGSASTINNNQTVCVRHTSAAAASTATNTTLTVGGVSDTFTSTTAAGPVVGLLPLLTGTGQLRLLDPTAATSGSNPVTVDTGLAPPPTDTGCNGCFDQAQVFITGTVAGTSVSNIHAARLAYAKRASGNNTGGMVFKINLVKGAASNLPTRISSLTDACEVVESDATDFAAIDNSAVLIRRAGPDHLCSTAADNTVTVIRLSSLVANAGVDLPLVFDEGKSLAARTSATGAITGFVSFESNGSDTRLVRRDANLANPVTLLTMADTTGANIESTDLTHLFVTATPFDQALQLFRVETSGALSPTLYGFQEFNANNPMQEGLHDAANLYFSDGNKMLRVPVGSVTENAVVIATLDPSLRIVGSRALDTSTTPGRLVFEAQDDSLTVASGVFSAAVNASNAAVTTLANYPDSLGGSARVVLATGGRAYINIANHGDVPEDARRINTDGTGASTITGAYWAGSTRANAFDLAQDSDVPVQSILLARRVVTDGVGTDTLSVVSPASGTAGIVLGSIVGAAGFEAIRVNGFGNRVLARVEVDRFGNLDNDVYVLDTLTAASLAPLSETDGSNDIPLDD